MAAQRQLEVAKLAPMVDLLVERYGELGRRAGEHLARWLSGEIPYAYSECLERHLADEHVALVFDAFYQVLPFGTGGRRGRVGYGANRLNPTTVAMTVQGHCNYLKERFADREGELLVVVANDVREFHDSAGVYRFLGPDHPLLGLSSRGLGRLACEVYAGNGIAVFFMQPEAEHALLTTPELSFAIGRLGAVGGLNVSASHNPPDDNGIKLYDELGSQPVAPDDQALIDAMSRATDIRTEDFAQALDEGMIRPLPPELHERYLESYVELYDRIYEPRPDVPIVFTPLCGCGLDTAGQLLERLGFPLLTPPAEGPDGRFSVIPFNAPNPEVPQATAPARRFAEEQGSSVVLSSDPDADRVGLEIRLPDGSWYHFDGNQIGAILCYFAMLDPLGPQRRGLVMETLVTNKLLGRIVEEAGDSWIVDDLLVGFKYVADALKQLAREGRYRDVVCKPEQLVLATEESHGVIMIPEILDKDASPACMYLAALHQRLQSEGRTLLDYYAEIVEQLGGYDCVNRSIVMLGAEGMLRKDRLMESLRSERPGEIGGEPVRRWVDRWDQEVFGPFVSESDRLPRNVLQLFTDSFVVSIRPSGTEAKVKLYVQLLPDEEGPVGTPRREGGRDLLAAIRRRAHQVADAVYNQLLGRIGYSLGEAGLLLPDIVDLDRKLEFEATTVPELRRVVERPEGRSFEELLEWLRRQSAAMTPGADPLPALKAPVARLCASWKQDLHGQAHFEQLQQWASR